MNMRNLLLNRGALLVIFKRVLFVAALLFFGMIALIWWSVATLVEMNHRSQATATQLEKMEQRLNELDRRFEQRFTLPVSQ